MSIKLNLIKQENYIISSSGFGQLKKFCQREWQNIPPHIIRSCIRHLNKKLNAVVYDK